MPYMTHSHQLTISHQLMQQLYISDSYLGVAVLLTRGCTRWCNYQYL